MLNWYTINHPTTLHTHNETSDPLLLANDTLHCRMYPTCKFAISQHLATPGFPQCDHTVGELSKASGSLCCEV